MYNFSPGPTALPDRVCAQIVEELSGNPRKASILEIDSGSRRWRQLWRETKQKIIDLLDVSDGHAVLFMAGGASVQAAMIPMNLSSSNDRVYYLDSGYYSRRAIAEAAKFCTVDVISQLIGTDTTGKTFESTAAYLHYVDCETPTGREFRDPPFTPSGVPLVADLSSALFLKPMDTAAFGLAYASTQKALGVAGATLVLVSHELLDRARTETPAVYHYATQHRYDSCYATPPTFAIYVAGLLLDWIDQNGGVAELARRRSEVAARLYAAIDRSTVFHNSVAPLWRSSYSIPFTLPSAALVSDFLQAAQDEGMVGLGGHPSCGGIRATLGNALPAAAVDALIDLMSAFESRMPDSRSTPRR